MLKKIIYIKYLLTFSIFVGIALSLFQCGTPIDNEKTFNEGIDPNPPAIPKNFNAYPDSGIAILMWDYNTESDIDKYVIYKSTSLISDFLLIGNADKDTNTFYDSDVINSNKYYYYLRVQDINNNISDSTDIKRVYIRDIAIPDEDAYYTVTFTGKPLLDFGSYINKDDIGDALYNGNDIDEVYIKYDKYYLYLGIKYKKNDDNHDLIWMIDTKENLGATSQKDLDFFGDDRRVNYPNNFMRLMIASWAGGKPRVRLIEDNVKTIDITDKTIIKHVINDDIVEDEIKISFNDIFELGPGKVPLLSKLNVVIFSTSGNEGAVLEIFPDFSDVDGSIYKDIDIISFYSLTLDSDGK